MSCVQQQNGKIGHIFTRIATLCCYNCASVHPMERRFTNCLIKHIHIKHKTIIGYHWTVYPQLQLVGGNLTNCKHNISFYHHMANVLVNNGKLRCHAIVPTAHYSETPIVRKMSHWTESPFVQQPIIPKTDCYSYKRENAKNVLEMSSNDHWANN